VATNSILKNITIRDKKLASKFAGALENAEGKSRKKVDIPMKVKELSAEQIKDVFGGK